MEKDLVFVLHLLHIVCNFRIEVVLGLLTRTKLVHALIFLYQDSLTHGYLVFDSLALLVDILFDCSELD
jgi:hypothetical protein